MCIGIRYWEFCSLYGMNKFHGSARGDETPQGITLAGLKKTSISWVERQQWEFVFQEQITINLGTSGCFGVCVFHEERSLKLLNGGRHLLHPCKIT